VFQLLYKLSIAFIVAAGKVCENTFVSLMEIVKMTSKILFLHILNDDISAQSYCVEQRVQYTIKCICRLHLLVYKRKVRWKIVKPLYDQQLTLQSDGILHLQLSKHIFLRCVSTATVLRKSRQLRIVGLQLYDCSNSLIYLQLNEISS